MVLTDFTIGNFTLTLACVKYDVSFTGGLTSNPCFIVGCEQDTHDSEVSNQFSALYIKVQPHKPVDMSLVIDIM